MNPTTGRTTLQFSLFLTVILLGADIVLAVRTGLAAAWQLVALLAVGFLATLTVATRVRLAELERDEQRQLTSDDDAVQSARIFDRSEDTEALSISRTRDQFERWIVPLLGPGLALGLGLFAWLYGRHILSQSPEAAGTTLRIAALLIGQSFVLFLTGKTLVGLGHRPTKTNRGRRPKRPNLYRGPGIWLCTTAGVALVSGVACLINQQLLASMLYWTSLAVQALLVLLAVELGWNTIAELYRPRRAGQPNLTYETRLAGALVDPAPWVDTVAKAIDYQFGYSVSESWFFRFVRGALLPVILFQVVALYGLSCLVFIAYDEQGIVERNGIPSSPESILDPGFHWKRPWPFETVRRVSGKQIHRVVIGHTEAGPNHGHGHEDPAGHQAGEANEPLLWTTDHHAEQDLFLTPIRQESGDGAPVGLVNINVPVEYRIRDAHTHVYGSSNPDGIIRALVQQALVRSAATQDILELMTIDRGATSAALKQTIQAEADRHPLGIEILSVDIQNIHPPQPVAVSFENVLAAMEEKKAVIAAAEGFAQRQDPLATAAALQITQQAAATARERESLAEAEQYQFAQLVGLYERAPAVFRTRRTLRVLNEALRDTRKYIVSIPNANEVIEFNFEEAIPSNLFDLSPELSEDPP